MHNRFVAAFARALSRHHHAHPHAAPDVHFHQDGAPVPTPCFDRRCHRPHLDV